MGILVGARQKAMPEGKIIKEVFDSQAKEEADAPDFRQAAEALVDCVEKNRTQKVWEFPRGEVVELLNNLGFSFEGDDVEEILLKAGEYGKRKEEETKKQMIH